MKDKIVLICQECLARNYEVKKPADSKQTRFELMKYCDTCKKHTLHRESK